MNNGTAVVVHEGTTYRLTLPCDGNNNGFQLLIDGIDVTSDVAHTFRCTGSFFCRVGDELHEIPLDDEADDAACHVPTPCPHCCMHPCAFIQNMERMRSAGLALTRVGYDATTVGNHLVGLMKSHLYGDPLSDNMLPHCVLKPIADKYYAGSMDVLEQVIQEAGE